MILGKFEKNDAPLLIVMGQSNAHGHGTKLKKEESALFPLPNVFGLSRKYNQHYGLSKVTWESFSSEGMNLGETQDNTCCLASEFACLWQQEAEERKKHSDYLPDLFVIQISIGAQGVDEAEQDGLNMWYPFREEIMKPGNLEEVNISLYPLALQILALGIKSLKDAGKTPVILGLHFNQWETEANSKGEVLLRARDNYKKFFVGLYDALGNKCSTYLYYPHSEVYEDEPGRRYLIEVFEEIEAEEDHIHIIDISHSYLWNPMQSNKGIFQEDLVHYTREAQKWFAKFQFREIFGTKTWLLGDSITADGRYMSYIEKYLYRYRTDILHTYQNKGLCSENVTGLSEEVHPGKRPCILDRLDSILKEGIPDRAILCYGMNDGIYQPFNDSFFTDYQMKIKILVERLKEKGIEVYLMTPAPFEADDFVGALKNKEAKVEAFSYLTPYKGYDDVLKRYSDWIKEEWEARGHRVIDLHTALKRENAEKRITDSNYKSGDGIHPEQHGHFIIAASIIQKLYGVCVTDYFEQICEEEYQDTAWETFETKRFFFRGYEAIVVFPTQLKKETPWIYRTEFFGAFPTVDLAMLKMGYGVANLRISHMYGGCKAVKLMIDFCDYLAREFKFARQMTLFGFSRGGLYALHFAKTYPTRVKNIYFDAPVVDINSWPGKSENGTSAEWKDCRKIWHMDIGKPLFLQIVKQALDIIIENKIPIVLVYGEADEVVPYEENGLLIEKAYESSDVPFLLIPKPFVGHHPHSLSNPAKIVEFLTLN